MNFEISQPVAEVSRFRASYPAGGPAAFRDVLYGDAAAEELR
jgi:hypothetical protein